MSCVNITIPFPVEAAKLLTNEAKGQGRSFSEYIQKILNQHIGPIKPEKSIVVKKRKKVIIKRRK